MQCILYSNKEKIFCFIYSIHLAFRGFICVWFEYTLFGNTIVLQFTTCKFVMFEYNMNFITDKHHLKVIVIFITLHCYG